MKIQLPDFTKVQALVVGDVMLDRYFFGKASRISPEAPIPVVHIGQKENRPGGAGNAALNLTAIGANVKLMGIVGDDQSAQKLQEALKAANVGFQFYVDSEATTITKLRIISQHQQLLRLDFENGFREEYRHQLLNDFKEAVGFSNAVILSDYAKGTLGRACDFIDIARIAKVPVFVDPKSVNFEDYRGATVVKPNFREFEATVGHCCNEQDIVSKAHNLIKEHGIEAILLTRGEKGMTLIVDHAPEIHIPTRAKEVFDVTGAGDTVMALLAAGVGAGMDLSEAVRLANLGAGIVVGKLGAATVSVPELRRVAEHVKLGGVMNEEQMVLAREDAQAHGETVVMTCGCFDILHAGHVNYLEKAKKLGDRLIVAVNDDASVNRLKGKNRPINNLERRMAVLAGLSSVDWVVPFSEGVPERITKRLLPDIYVKGGDYKPDQVPEARCVIENGGELKLIDFVENCSTTAVIDRISQTIVEDKE